MSMRAIFDRATAWLRPVWRRIVPSLLPVALVLSAASPIAAQSAAGEVQHGRITARAVSPIPARLTLKPITAPIRSLEPTRPSAEPGNREVVVQNNRDVPVRVYVDARPFERLIGTVDPMRTARLSVPSRLVRDQEGAKLILEPIGGFPRVVQAPLSEQTDQLALLIPSTPEYEMEMAVLAERLAMSEAGDRAAATEVEQQL